MGVCRSTGYSVKRIEKNKRPPSYKFGLARALGEEIKEKAEWGPIETSRNPNKKGSTKDTLECNKCQ